MICPECKVQNPDGASHCARCGAFIPRPPARAATENDAALSLVIPVNRSWVAIVAGYLGLFSILILPAPLALLTGILAIVHLRNNPGKLGMGRAVFAIGTGLVGTAVLIALGIASITK